MSNVRIDKYLWAIRIFKTRGSAKKACDSGHVKLFGKSIKPAHTVKVDDELLIKAPSRGWVIKVTALAERRMPFKEAQKHYEDLTPEAEKKKPVKQKAAFYTGKRMSKTGKPTKKQRRQQERFLNK